jgi:hypothetical protein
MTDGLSAEEGTAAAPPAPIKALESTAANAVIFTVPPASCP